MGARAAPILRRAAADLRAAIPGGAALVAFASVLAAGCALPVVSAGTFLPAGDLQKGEMHASVSMEAGRVLAGPSDVHDKPATVPGAEPWEVSTWFASDVSLRYQAHRRLSVEAQLKLTNPILPFTSAQVGGSLGARLRLFERTAAIPWSVELAARTVFVAVQERLSRTHDGVEQIDRWNYRALGVEVPLVASYRVNPLFAATLAPFLRAYWIRAWHQTETRDQATVANLQWSPVLSGGIGISGALDLGPVELAPGIAVELATRPGPNAPTHVLFEPGLSVGTRF